MFQSIYYRNNRNSGQKNLRCFPACSDVHVERHFCGRPVEVVVTMSYPVPTSASSTPPIFKLSDIRLVAEFALLPTDDVNESAATQSSSLPRGASPNRHYLGRATSNCSAEVAEGEWISSFCTFEFNSECKGWHYSWVGSRFSTVLNHAYLVSLYIPKASISGSSLVVHPQLQSEYRLASFVAEELQDPYPPNRPMQKMCIFSSPSFHIASLRRKGNVQKALRIERLQGTPGVYAAPSSEAASFGDLSLRENSYEAKAEGVRRGPRPLTIVFGSSFSGSPRNRPWQDELHEGSVKSPRHLDATSLSAPSSPGSPNGKPS